MRFSSRYKGLVQVMGAMSTKDNYAAPVLTQLYANSGNTRDLLSSVGVPNNAVMTMKELRDHVTRYVDANELRISEFDAYFRFVISMNQVVAKWSDWIQFYTSASTVRATLISKSVHGKSCTVASSQKLILPIRFNFRARRLHM